MPGEAKATRRWDRFDSGPEAWGQLPSWDLPSNGGSCSPVLWLREERTAFHEGSTWMKFVSNSNVHHNSSLAPKPEGCWRGCKLSGKGLGYRVLWLTHEGTCDMQGVVAVLEPLLREAVPPETTATNPWPGALWIRDAAGQPGTPGAYSTEGSIFTNSTTGSSSHRDSFTQSRTATTNNTAKSTYLSAR